MDPIETMQAAAESLTAQMSELQARADSFGGVVSTIDEVAEQAARLVESQTAHASFSEEADRTISDLTTKVNELRTVVEDVMTAKEESEKLIADFTGPKGSFSEIRAGMDELMVSVSRMEVRSNAFDDSFGKAEERILGVTEQAAELEQVQKVMERSFESVSKSLVETDAKASELGDAFQSAGVIKGEFEDLVGPHGALAKVRAQIEETREQSLVYGQEVARTQEDQAGVRAAQESISSQYKELRSKLEAVDEGVDKANANVARVDKAKLDLTKAEELGARTERQLNALQALSDHIVQKTGALERQREALDRTEAQARALTDLHWELEAKLKEAKLQIQELKKVHDSVDDLRDVNAKVAERTAELRAEQTDVEHESKTLRAGLAGLQEQMRRTTKRFELEQSTLEADGQRVIALRADVTDLENRLRGLEETGSAVSEASRRVDDMSARLTSLSGQLGRISEQVELVEGMREGMSEAERTAVDVAASLSRLEARQSDVQDSLDALRTLRGAGERRSPGRWRPCGLPGPRSRGYKRRTQRRTRGWPGPTNRFGSFVRRSSSLRI